MRDMTKPVGLPYFYCIHDILFSFLNNVTLIHSSHYQAIWFSPPCSSTIFQTFQVSTFRCVQISAPYTAVLQMQHFTSLFFKYTSNLLVNSFILVERCFCHDNPGFNFPFTYRAICYYATQIVEMFHILRLLWIYHYLHWGMVAFRVITVEFSGSIPFHSIFQFKLFYQLAL